MKKEIIIAIVIVSIYFFCLYYTFIQEKKSIVNPYRERQLELEKELGVEEVQLPSKDAEIIHTMIEKAIKASWHYYVTNEDKELESIKGLYLIKEYEKVISEILREKTLKSPCLNPPPPSYVKIPRIEFSKFRRYKGLKDRIGVISKVPEFEPLEFSGGCERQLIYIFLLRQIDGDWKIEKQQKVLLVWEEIEFELIKEIKEKEGVKI